MTDRHTPLATYRLQLTNGFGFTEATQLVDYLAELGVSDLYLSPVLTARPGSTHGYDVADPTTVAAPLGGEEALRALAQHAQTRGLGVVVDIVPNHLGTGPRTPLWELLLAEGQYGPAGGVFDVDWHPALPGAEGKVVLPVLGKMYGEVLAHGELAVSEEHGELRLHYFDHSFPLSQESSDAARRSGLGGLAGTPGQPETWTRLHGLLELQHYRLVFWRVGDAVVNYRRFFAINELAAVRVEDEDVFEQTHARILQLVADGVVNGLRVDHPDGLRDPGRYLERLEKRTGGVWTVVEKILHQPAGQPGERLPDWPVAGSTGYEFANDVLHLFVDGSAAAALTAVDVDFAASTASYDEQARAAKRFVLAHDLAADTRRLARRLWALAQRHLEARDVDDATCLEVLTRTIAALDVYRTYVDPETGEATQEDVERIVAATRRSGNEPLAGPLAMLLERILTGCIPHTPDTLDLLARFQQLSGAAMAKGVEDTLFYRYRRLLAVNEVGGDPSRLGLSVEEFHQRNLLRARRHPAGMVTTSTHDTKRGEDVRLRMAALSELAERWAEQVVDWRVLNAPHVRWGAQGPSPDPQTEYLLYQTLIGVWPLEPHADVRPAIRDRLVAYTVKASREAKERTSWTDPDETFEDALGDFIDAVLDPAQSPAFLERVAAFAAGVQTIAMVSGLAQVLLRIMAPGVPDTYQGTELWDDSLVDPDNRRAVDFTARRRMLAELDAGADPSELLVQWRDGRVKLWVLSRALRTRRAQASCVAPGSRYLPLQAAGRFADRVVAFARTPPDGSDGLVIVAPRLPVAVMGRDLVLPLGEVWDDTAVVLPSGMAGEHVDVLTGRRHGAQLPLRELLAVLPVALLAPVRR